ncbi:MAG: hypothetical protein IJU96_08080 [Clostridia bacterium]|nr:hypothetical protein [Clostridia bacterium]
MKAFSEFFKKLTNHTKLFLLFSLLLLAVVFFVSACLFLLSQRCETYYVLEEYADALLLCLRPCCAVLGVGAIALQWLETREQPS